VLPISTVSPLRDLMISDGQYDFEETKFSTNPKEQLKFTFKFNSTAAQNAQNILHAPDLSMYIFSIKFVGFKLRPPASKHKPLPIRAIVVF